MERDVSESLEWLWNQCDSDIGLSSNFGVMADCSASLGSTMWRDHFNEYLMHAISRKREIEKVFYKLSDLHQNVLFACFGWTSLGMFPPLLRNVYGEYTPIVLYFHPGDNKESRAKWKEEARQLYRAAIIEFYTIQKQNKRRK
jgi:hypothetical protein